jgi:hypothetical protein
MLSRLPPPPITGTTTQSQKFFQMPRAESRPFDDC